jgi:hypothetical protein
MAITIAIATATPKAIVLTTPKANATAISKQIQTVQSNIA